MGNAKTIVVNGCTLTEFFLLIFRECFAILFFFLLFVFRFCKLLVLISYVVSIIRFLANRLAFAFADSVFLDIVFRF